MAVVVLVVVVLVVVRVAGSSSGAGGTRGPVDAPVPAGVAAAVTGVPLSVTDAVGVPSAVTAPFVDSTQPPLVIGGKPGAIYIGGEFCPNCAAERWAIVVAFARFGTFSGLELTTSSPWDGTPIATFSFRHTTFDSRYVSFQPVEYQGNDSTGIDTHVVIQPLTAQQSRLWAAYSDKYAGGEEGFPFLTVGNRVVVMGRSYDPTPLYGLSAPQIARALSDPTDPVARGVVGTANLVTAGICSLTGERPDAVCSASGVAAARKALGLH